MATKKKEPKGKDIVDVPSDNVTGSAIATKAEMKTFLVSVRDRLMSNAAPPIFGMAAMNHVLQHPELYELVDSGNREVLQEIWVKVSQAGMHVRRPPLLFGDTPEVKS